MLRGRDFQAQGLTEVERRRMLLTFEAIHYTRSRDERASDQKRSTDSENLEYAALQYAKAMGWAPQGSQQ